MVKQFLAHFYDVTTVLNGSVSPMSVTKLYFIRCVLFDRKHFAGELAENMLVRFIFNGRELRHDASTLQSCNITDGSVIHCLLTRGAQQEENTEQQQQVLFEKPQHLQPVKIY